jgi:hypothetical protein
MSIHKGENSMESLMQLSEEYQELVELASSADPEDEQTFLDTLDGMTGIIENKMDGYGVVLTQMKARIAMIDGEIKRLQAWKQTVENNDKRMRDVLLLVMRDTLNQRKIQTDLHTFTICKNGGKQGVDIFAEVPDSFQRIIYEPDTDKIREALENGEDLPFARLRERGEHVRIK